MLKVSEDQQTGHDDRAGSVPDTDFNLAELEKCLKMRDAAAACAIAERLVEAAADQPRLIERVSLILEDLGAFDVAERLIRETALRHPMDLWIAVRHAKIATIRGDLGIAHDRWSKVIDEWPNASIGSIGLAELRLAEGDYEAAERLYLTAATRFSDDVWVADGLASVATARRNWVEAVKRWADVYARFPDHVRAREQLSMADEQLRHGLAYSWAESAQKQGNLIEAARRWQKLIDQFPDWVEAYLRLASLNRLLARTRRTVDVLRTASLRFPADTQVRLALLDAAWADGSVDLTLDTLAWLGEQKSDSQTLKQASSVMRECLDNVASFDAFRRVSLLALAEPSDASLGTVQNFILETAAVWPDRRTWIERVCAHAAYLPDAERSRMTQLATCRLMLDQPFADNSVRAVDTSLCRVIPLSKPLNAAESGEALRRRSKALFAHLNAFVGDRRLRRYQADILKTGTIGFGDLFGKDSPGFSGCLYFAPPKAFTYRFIIDGAGYWLITGLAAEGYRIVAAYDEATGSLFYEGADPTSDLNGFLGRQVHDIQIVASNGVARLVPEPRVIFVSGFGNYAHYMWNELPSLFEIEHWSNTKVDEVAVVYEPFGPFRQLVRWEDGPNIRTTSNAEIGGDGQFQEALLFTAGSNLVTTETRRRLREVCAVQANGRYPEGRGAFTVWVSLRRMYRHATNMQELLASVIRRIERAGMTVDILLDGFSLPFDVAVDGRYDKDYYLRHQQIVATEARSLIFDLNPMCRHVRLLDTTWATLPIAVAIAARADFYICHHGTQQHKIGWMYDIPGLIHGNVDISAKNPRGGWVQAQCDSPMQPDYFPARFIGDAVTDNERQDMASFRDYQFVEIEECADFVFARICIEHHRWLTRGMRVETAPSLSDNYDFQ